MKPYRSIAIAGSHGKTTTTSIIASIFNAANLSPTYVIGGQVLSVGRSSNLGEGDYIIVEADESDGSFLHLQPDIAVITNIDNDHLSFYESNQKKLNQSFVSFAENLPFYGYILLNLDDSNIRKISKDIHRRQITFGFSSKNRFQIVDVKLKKGVQKFKLTDHNNKKQYKFSTNLSGRHNLYNVTAAICVAIEENISIKNISKGLNDFQGVGRRFEISKLYFTEQPHVLIDDYGHHPAEILSAILAAKEKFPRNKICMIFEPHRFTRTQQLFDDFVKVLSRVDFLLLLDIYPASEKPIKGISSKRLASQISKNHKNVRHIGSKDSMTWLQENYHEFSILITQGAGTISRLNNEIKKKWQ
jgi:UDP-N-acetylmuramate--alanine ligase